MPDTFALDGPWPTGRAPVEAWTWQTNTTTGNIDIVPIGGSTPPVLDTIGNIQMQGGGSYTVGDSFSVVATHTGSVAASSLSYSWTLNGTPYTGFGSNTNTIYIASATTADSGTWVCTVTAPSTVVSDSPQVGQPVTTTVTAATIGNVQVQLTPTQPAGGYTAGTSVTATATHTGTSQNITWYHQEPGIHPSWGSGNTVTVSSITAANGGQWLFEAEDYLASDGPFVQGFVTVNVASAPLVLDLYPNDFVAAYSLQQLTTSWTGDVVKVRSAGGGTPTGIGTSGGKLDDVALAFFCGVNNGFAVEWYDQTGNGKHVSQATATQQPLIFDSTLQGWGSHYFDPVNNQAALDFDGDNANGRAQKERFRLASANLGSQPFTIFQVIGTKPVGRVRSVSGYHGANRLFIDTVGANPTTWRINSGTSAISSTAVSSSVESYITTTEFNGSSSNMWVRPYGTSFATSSSVQVLNNVNTGNKGITGDLLIGSNPLQTAFHGGPIQEILIANKIFTPAQRTQIEDEIASRY